VDGLLFVVVLLLEAEVFFDEYLVPEVFVLAVLFFAVVFREVFLRAPLPEALFAGGGGSFTPSLRASERPMAIACFGFFARPW